MGASVARMSYDIHLDVKFDPLTLIDLDAEAAAVEPWFNQTLTQVNDAVVRLGVIEGDFHWHKHDVEDEFFLVLDGQLLIDVEGPGTVTLDPHQAYTVPRGVVHRTRAPVRTAILMVEPAGVCPPATRASRTRPARVGVHVSAHPHQLAVAHRPALRDAALHRPTPLPRPARLDQQHRQQLVAALHHALDLEVHRRPQVVDSPRNWSSPSAPR